MRQAVSAPRPVSTPSGRGALHGLLLDTVGHFSHVSSYLDATTAASLLDPASRGEFPRPVGGYAAPVLLPMCHGNRAIAYRSKQLERYRGIARHRDPGTRR